MIGSKWWLGLFLLYIIIVILCLVTEGSFLGAGQVDQLSKLSHLSVSFGSIKTIWDVFTTCFTWNFAFFQSGIGVYIKLPLICLTVAVAIPFIIDLARVILKPFGG